MNKSKQVQVLLALAYGQHLSEEELVIAKQAVHSVTKELESRINN